MHESQDAFIHWYPLKSFFERKRYSKILTDGTYLLDVCWAGSIISLVVAFVVVSLSWFAFAGTFRKAKFFRARFAWFLGMTVTARVAMNSLLTRFRGSPLIYSVLLIVFFSVAFRAVYSPLNIQSLKISRQCRPFPLWGISSVYFLEHLWKHRLFSSGKNVQRTFSWYQLCLWAFVFQLPSGFCLHLTVSAVSRPYKLLLRDRHYDLGYCCSLSFSAFDLFDSVLSKAKFCKLCFSHFVQCHCSDAHFGSFSISLTSRPQQ